jgi:uracil-DNA glycosylase family 4
MSASPATHAAAAASAAAPRTLAELSSVVVQCRACPRLVAWREQVARERKREFLDWTYWGKPVPGFGDPQARLLIVGLAPAAHGANRTGRMFTGDSSGDWLYEALHRFGFASAAASRDWSDGLELRDCYITAAARCAPPDNKPTREELDHCRPFLTAELPLLPHLRVVLGLGRIGYDAYLKAAGIPDRPPFGHGVETALSNGVVLVASYHPSRQNTNTGRLTRRMWNAVFRRVTGILNSGEK